MALTWRIAPKTSPVIPPNRRRAVRWSSQPANSPAASAASPRTASDGPARREACDHDRAGERAGRDRAVNRRGPAGDKGAEPAGPGRGGGGRDDDRHPAGDLGEHKRGGGQWRPGYRRDRRHLDEQHQHERADPHGADVGAAHDLQRAGGGAAAAEPVGGIGESVEVQAAGEDGDGRDRERRPEQPPRAGRVELPTASTTQAPMPPSSSPIAGSHRIARAATSSSTIPLTPAGMVVKRLIATRQAGGCRSLTGCPLPQPPGDARGAQPGLLALGGDARVQPGRARRGSGPRRRSRARRRAPPRC